MDHSEGHANRHVRHIGIGLRGGFVAGLFRGLAADRVGIAIAICVLAYSAGPFPLAYNGWGMSAYCCFTGLYRSVSPIIYRR